MKKKSVHHGTPPVFKMWAAETVINPTNGPSCVPLDLKILPAIPNRESAASQSANAEKRALNYCARCTVTCQMTSSVANELFFVVNLVYKLGI
jgi:hypothetical protein